MRQDPPQIPPPHPAPRHTGFKYILYIPEHLQIQNICKCCWDEINTLVVDAFVDTQLTAVLKD